LVGFFNLSLFLIVERQLLADPGPSYAGTSHNLNVSVEIAERQETTQLGHSS
jgi:hypothetical protein